MSYEPPKYTQTPNLFYDEHLADMGPTETKVVLAVIRETFGWHRRKYRLSITDFMDITGLSNRGVIDGLEAAMERGIIDRDESVEPYKYWLVVDTEDGGENTSPGAEDGGEKSSPRGEKSSPEVVRNSHNPSYYNGKKDKERGDKKKSTPPADAGDAPASPPEEERAAQEEPPPEERVELEWTYDFALAAMKHLQHRDLIAPVTEKKIDREGEEAVAVQWADTFRLLHEQDGYSKEEIEATMIWLFKVDDFWLNKGALASVPPLRSKTKAGDQYKFDSMYQSARNHYERSTSEPSELSFEQNQRRIRRVLERTPLPDK